MKIPFQKQVGLAIGIPSTGRYVPLQWAMGLVGQGLPINLRMGYYPIVGATVDDARNGLAEIALQNGYEYLCMWDDDTVPPPNGLRNLYHTLVQTGPPHDNVMVCVGIVPCKSEPTEPNVYKQRSGGASWDWKAGEIFEVAEAGSGLMMIRTEVFGKLEPPWFETVDKTAEHGNSPDVMIRDWTGEDIGFCRKVSDAGFKILAHGSVICDHFDEHGKCYRLPADSLPFKKS